MAYIGICLALASLIWHAANRGSCLPLGDNFEALTVRSVSCWPLSRFMCSEPGRCPASIGF